MLPWWVRKRKSSAVDASAASSTQSLRLYQSGSRPKAKTLNKDVEVSPAASLQYVQMQAVIARQAEPCMPCTGGASGGQ